MGAAGSKRIALCVCALALAAAGAASAETTLARPSVDLGKGRQGDFIWSIEAKRPDGDAGKSPTAGQRPCLLVGTKWQIGPFNFHRSSSRQCAGASKLTPMGPPLIASGSQPSGGPAQLTAVGMIFAPAVHRARITLADGRTKSIDLRRPGAAQAHEAGLERFRYAAFAVHGVWCAERVVSVGGSGRVLWDSGTDGYSC